MAWIGVPKGASMRSATYEPGSDAQAPPLGFTASRTKESDALARWDAISPGTDDLHLGWLWVVGRATIDGTERTVTLPLLSRPAAVRTSPLGLTVTYRGAWDLWSLVTDDVAAAELEAAAEFGGGALYEASQAMVDRLTRLRAWVDAVVSASTLPRLGQLLAPQPPRAVVPNGSLQAVVGFGLYAHAPLDDLHPKETLTAWSTDAAVARTAFTSLYLSGTSAAVPTSDVSDGSTANEHDDVRSPLPLNQRQREVVVRARTEPVVVVSGPPGTGKSQTAAAVALDTVARGGSVLVATQSATASEVLAGLLDRVPGPTPVLFGGGTLAGGLATKLADGLTTPADRNAPERAAIARRALDELGAAVVADLDAVRAAAQWQERSLTLTHHSLVAPRLLDPDGTCALEEADAARATATEAVTGWWSRRRRRKAEADLRNLVGAPNGSTLEQIVQAVDLAHVREQARRAGHRDPTQAERRWTATVDALDRTDRTWAEALAAEVTGSVDGKGRRAVGDLATALRTGRAGRRRHLANVEMSSLTRALPLWVGTLGDIEALLPAEAAAFDVVILDEASQIDQLTASGALLRAERVVVIGDPRQLRFVSFVADADIEAAIGAEGTQDVAARLDVRRVSAFDLGASAAAVTMLEEHYRSVPHLIGFSAHRFYDDRLFVATRHPANDHRRAIEVRHLAGDRVDGVNQIEVAAAVAEVQAVLAADPHTTIGVVSPYRAQVDAIFAAVGQAISLDQLQSGRVRVGTVHGFQGGECDVMVASMAIGGVADRGRGFLEDPHLFNVLITRARQRMVVLVSGDAPTSGLLSDYLRWAEQPPGPPASVTPTDEWTRRLLGVLVDAGVPVRSGYPVGRWLVDLVVGDGASARAVTTRVHPDGITAHVHRHLALHRAGWQQAEAFPTDHDGDPVATALALRELTEVTVGGE